MANIYFHNHHTCPLKNRSILKFFLAEIFKKEGKRYSQIDIIFCSDKYLKHLNTKFLKHNYYTDTLTFILNSNPIIGEIYISVESVKENAELLNIKYSVELIRVIIHGCLHLCGYTDKPKTKASKMINRQEFYLKKWLVSRETQIGG